MLIVEVADVVRWITRGVTMHSSDRILDFIGCSSGTWLRWKRKSCNFQVDTTALSTFTEYYRDVIN